MRHRRRARSSTAIPGRSGATRPAKSVIKSYTITNMAHGTPLATGAADHECGAAGPFLLEVGISSSYHIAKFFGLTGSAARAAAATDDRADHVTEELAAKPSQGRGLKRARPQSRILDGEILGPDDPGPDRHASPDRDAPPAQFDVGTVINNALKAARLMK